MDRWKKVENEKGFPLYIDQVTNVQQWDHPKFEEIRRLLDECNYVKYSTYRVAIKLRVLRHALHMDEVLLNTVKGVFERHRLGANESSLCLETCDLEAVLSDILFASNKINQSFVDVDSASEIMVTFLYNVFDVERKGQIQVSSVKLVLAILSKCNLNELYRFIFEMCCDHNNCVTRLKLQSNLMKIVDLINFLREDTCFGKHLVNPSIEHCFKNSPGLVGITEANFLAWLESGPQIISFLPLLHRIKSAEKVVHYNKCNTCKTTPIMGLRYRCIKCTRYTQCQRCFFTGRLSHSHKLTHSMREYATQENGSNSNMDLTKRLLQTMWCFGKNKTPIVEPNLQNTITKPFEPSVTCEVQPLSSIDIQLQTIIQQLEVQNKELQDMLRKTNQPRKTKDLNRCLHDQYSHIATQIDKLKHLKDCLRNEGKEVLKRLPIESTPVVPQNVKLRSNQNLHQIDLFSPIPQYGGKIVEETDTIVEDYSVDDISTWIGDLTSSKNANKNNSKSRTSPPHEFYNDLDDALAKLQQILANNFAVEESASLPDNNCLKNAVFEVEDMLTSFIDNIEITKSAV